eukprot:5900353-Prymnesium_polylepis.1
MLCASACIAETVLPGTSAFTRLARRGPRALVHPHRPSWSHRPNLPVWLFPRFCTSAARASCGVRRGHADSALSSVLVLVLVVLVVLAQHRRG